MRPICIDCHQPVDEEHDWAQHPQCPKCQRRGFGGMPCAYCTRNLDLAARAEALLGRMTYANVTRTRTWQELEDDSLEEVRLDRLDGRIY